jgi:hypothetical protein
LTVTTAAALGYGITLKPEDIILAISIGATCMEAVLVKAEQDPSWGSFQRCRVLGRASACTGGSVIDAWLCEETLAGSGLSPGDNRFDCIRSLLTAAGRVAKERLSIERAADILVTDPQSGQAIRKTWTRASFEALIEKCGFFTGLDQVVRRSLASAYARGYDTDRISAVMLIGGTACIPSVREWTRSRFNGKQVYCDRPQDCVARGAVLSLSEGFACDAILHDYALRYWDDRENTYQYRIIVRKGTSCPSPGIVARVFIRAIMDDQIMFGFPVFMVEENQSESREMLELIPERNGEYLLSPVSASSAVRPLVRWINEQDFPIITLDIPSARNETRLELTCAISGNRSLVVTARDLKTGKTVAKDLFAARLA